MCSVPDWAHATWCSQKKKIFFKDTHKENDSKRLDLNVKPKTIKLLDNRIKP